MQNLQITFFLTERFFSFNLILNTATLTVDLQIQSQPLFRDFAKLALYSCCRKDLFVYFHKNEAEDLNNDTINTN